MPVLATLAVLWLSFYDTDLIRGWTYWLACTFLVECYVSDSSCTAAGAPAQNTTTLKLVLPSIGQTGSTSVLEAARLMGYRSYHQGEVYAFAPSVYKSDMRDPVASFAAPLSRCNVEALALGEAADVLPVAVQTSPSAKFVLTWRTFDGRLGSTIPAGQKDTRLSQVVSLITNMYLLLPWTLVYEAVTGELSRISSNGEPFDGNQTMASLLYTTFPRRPLDMDFPDRVSYRVGDEEAYLAHVDEIRRLVPPERLLEFDVSRHGWKELADFMGWQVPPGTPFPYLRSKTYRTNDLLWQKQLPMALTAHSIFLFLGILNLVVLTTVMRACLWVPRLLLGCV